MIPPTEAPAEIVVASPSPNESVNSVVRSLGFRLSEFSSVDDLLNAEAQASASCFVLCASNGNEAASELQEKLLSQNSLSPSIIIISDVEVRDAVKLMERGALTILTSQFEPIELANYLKIAAQRDRERREIRQRVQELELCRESLSDRQLKILNMVEQGHSNRQIANCFDLSQRTIELERARLMSAFQSASVAQLVSKWTELRVLSRTWHPVEHPHGETQQENVLNA